MSLNPRVTFCLQCDNRLYHTLISGTKDKNGKEEPDRLGWSCRSCGEVIENTDGSVCVLSTHILGRRVEVDTLVNEHTKHDPALPHQMMHCPNSKCPTNEKSTNGLSDVAVLRDDAEQLTFIYICTTCDHTWH
jgi:DNA-directed RNA polymerase subunit M/transcription elongation factor TFIIS